MHCPACRISRLQPAKLEDGLLGHGCPQCAGTRVSLLHYRNRAERQSAEETATALAAEAEVGGTRLR